VVPDVSDREGGQVRERLAVQHLLHGVAKLAAEAAQLRHLQLPGADFTNLEPLLRLRRF
jgi:hypothetical protein